MLSQQNTARCTIAMAAMAWALPSIGYAESNPNWITEDSYAPTEANEVDNGSSYAHLNDSNGESVVEVIRERFPNGNVKIERCVVLDRDGNYVNHGAWKMFTTEGGISAEGQYDMGQRVGVWTRYFGRNDAPLLNEFPYKRFKAPFVAQANFVNGVMDGDWIVEDADKHKVVQVTFKMGHRHGTMITWLPTGKMFRQATFEEGVPVGDVMEVNSKTNEFERSATYVDGRKIVTKTTHYPNGRQKKTEEMFLAATTVQKSADDFWNLKLAEYTTQGNDLRHGESKSWYANGKPRKEGNYQFDKKLGTFTYWYENGQTETSGEYKNDLPEGTWVWFHENGQKKSIGNYQEGALIGDWRWWNTDGKLTKQTTYDGTESVTAQEPDSLDVGQRTDEETSVR